MISENKKTSKKISTYLVVSVCLLLILGVGNGFAYGFLPDRIVSQVNLMGNPSTYLPKLLFLLSVPLIAIGITIYGAVSEEEKRLKILVANIILVGVNFFVIFMNLTRFK